MSDTPPHDGEGGYGEQVEAEPLGVFWETAGVVPPTALKVGYDD